MTAVVGLVLAAGAGTRFGGPKAVVEIDGERLVDRAVRTLLDGGAAPAYVVSGALDVEVSGAVVVTNPDWEEGIGSSLRAGLAALANDRADTVAALVLLVDQPGLTAEAVSRVMARADGPDVVVVATYDGELGHPVAIGRDHWAEVARHAIGDRGARPFLDAHPELVTQVECADVATSADLDLPSDLDRFRLTR